MRVAAGSGFGDSGPRAAKKTPKLARYLEQQVPTTVGDAGGDAGGWFEVPEVDAVASFASKPIKPVILPTGRAIMLYKIGENIFCSDANSTA
jgi:hypothetical protein